MQLHLCEGWALMSLRMRPARDAVATYCLLHVGNICLQCVQIKAQAWRIKFPFGDVSLHAVIAGE